MPGVEAESQACNADVLTIDRDTNQLKKIDGSSASVGEVLTITSDGTNNCIEWGPAGASNLDDLNDVDVPMPSMGEVLTWDGSEWVAAVPPGMGGGEANTGANVGGEPGELFQNKLGITMNFRTLGSSNSSLDISTAGSVVDCAIAGFNGSGALLRRNATDTANESIFGTSTGVLYHNGTVPLFTAAGTDGQQLQIVAGVPTWTSVSSLSSVDNVGTGSGLVQSAPVTSGAVLIKSIMNGTAIGLVDDGSTVTLSLDADLNDLNDVDVSGVAPGEVLTYDGTGGWISSAPAGTLTVQNAEAAAAGEATLLQTSPVTSGIASWKKIAEGSNVTVTDDGTTITIAAATDGSTTLADIDTNPGVVGTTTPQTGAVGLKTFISSDDTITIANDGTGNVSFVLNADLDDLNDVNIGAPSDGDVLTYQGTGWTTVAPTPHNNTLITTSTTGDEQLFDGTGAFNGTETFKRLTGGSNIAVSSDADQITIAFSGSLADLTDVNSAGAADGQVLTYDGTGGWVASSVAATTTMADLNANPGVIGTTTPQSGAVGLKTFTSVDSTIGIANDGTDSVSFILNADLDDLNDVNIGAPSDGDVLTYQGTGWTTVAPTPHNNTLITTSTTGDEQLFDGTGAFNGTETFKRLTGGSNIAVSSDADQITIAFSGSLADLTDVNSAGAADGQVLTYDGTGGWVASSVAATTTLADTDASPGVVGTTTPQSGAVVLKTFTSSNATLAIADDGTNSVSFTLSANIADLDDVNTGTPSDGDVLTYQGTGWTISTPTPHNNTLITTSTTGDEQLFDGTGAFNGTETFKRITGGSNIAVSSDADQITIAFSGSLADLTDVNSAGATAGQVLTYDGTGGWVASAAAPAAGNAYEFQGSSPGQVAIAPVDGSSSLNNVNNGSRSVILNGSSVTMNSNVEDTAAVGENLLLDNVVRSVVMGKDNNLGQTQNSVIAGANFNGTDGLFVTSSFIGGIGVELQSNAIVANSMIAGNNLLIDDIQNSVIGGRDHVSLDNIQNTIVNGIGHSIRTGTTMYGIFTGSHHDVDVNNDSCGMIGGSNNNISTSVTNTVLIGGSNNGIASAENNSVILGGTGIFTNALATTPSATGVAYMPSMWVQHIASNNDHDQFLTWDATSGQVYSRDLASFEGSRVSTLADADANPGVVGTTTPQTGAVELKTFISSDSTIGIINSGLDNISLTLNADMSDLSDVVLSSLTDGDILTYQGTAWQNVPRLTVQDAEAAGAGEVNLLQTSPVFSGSATWKKLAEGSNVTLSDDGTTITITAMLDGTMVSGVSSIEDVDGNPGVIGTIVPQTGAVKSKTFTSTDSTIMISNDGTGNVSFVLDADLNELNDVTITSETASDVLKYNGTEWVNEGLAVEELANFSIDGTDVAVAGDVLTYNGTDWQPKEASGGGGGIFRYSTGTGAYITADGTGVTFAFGTAPAATLTIPASVKLYSFQITGTSSNLASQNLRLAIIDNHANVAPTYNQSVAGGDIVAIRPQMFGSMDGVYYLFGIGGAYWQWDNSSPPGSGNINLDINIHPSAVANWTLSCSYLA